MKTSVPPQPADVVTGPLHSRKGSDITGLASFVVPDGVFTSEHVPELHCSMWGCSERRPVVRTAMLRQ